MQAYTSDGAECYPCSNNCLSCIITDAATGATGCTVCGSGYILFMGSCTSQCPANYYPLQSQCYRCSQNCQTCTSLPSSCINCTNNTFLLNGNCIQQCPNGTYQSVSTASCVPCDDRQCVLCPANASECSVCNLPFMANTGSTKRCDTCAAGYLWDASGVCNPCSPTCLTCSGRIDSCTSCNTGKLILNGNCVDNCPNGYY